MILPSIFELDDNNIITLKETGEKYFRIYEQNAIIRKNDICQFDVNKDKVWFMNPNSELVGDDNDQRMVIFRPMNEFSHIL